ncbi:unnamed protein product [Musa hybrid cultivar]
MDSLRQGLPLGRRGGRRMERWAYPYPGGCHRWTKISMPPSNHHQTSPKSNPSHFLFHPSSLTDTFPLMPATQT